MVPGTKFDWSGLRFWRRAGAFALLAFIPAFVFAARSESAVLVYSILAAAPLLFALFAHKIAAFRCPACGGGFQASLLTAGSNCVHCGLRCYATSADDADSTVDPALSALFQRRRKMWLKIGVPFFVVGFCGWLLALGLMVARVGSPMWGVAVFVTGVVVFIVATAVLMRCPRCRRLPVEGRHMSIDPDYCPNCGLYFK